MRTITPQSLLRAWTYFLTFAAVAPMFSATASGTDTSSVVLEVPEITIQYNHQFQGLGNQLLLWSCDTRACLSTILDISIGERYDYATPAPCGPAFLLQYNSGWITPRADNAFGPISYTLHDSLGQDILTRKLERRIRPLGSGRYFCTLSPGPLDKIPPIIFDSTLVKIGDLSDYVADGFSWDAGVIGDSILVLLRSQGLMLFRLPTLALIHNSSSSQPLPLKSLSNPSRAFSENGSTVAVSNQTEVVVVNLWTGESASWSNYHIHGTCLSPDGRTLYVVLQKESRIGVREFRISDSGLILSGKTAWEVSDLLPGEVGMITGVSILNNRLVATATVGVRSDQPGDSRPVSFVLNLPLSDSFGYRPTVIDGFVWADKNRPGVLYAAIIPAGKINTVRIETIRP